MEKQGVNEDSVQLLSIKTYPIYIVFLILYQTQVLYTRKFFYLW